MPDYGAAFLAGRDVTIGLSDAIASAVISDSGGFFVAYSDSTLNTFNVSLYDIDAITGVPVFLSNRVFSSSFTPEFISLTAIGENTALLCYSSNTEGGTYARTISANFQYHQVYFLGGTLSVSGGAGAGLSAEQIGPDHFIIANVNGKIRMIQRDFPDNLVNFGGTIYSFDTNSPTSNAMGVLDDGYIVLAYGTSSSSAGGRVRLLSTNPSLASVNAAGNYVDFSMGGDVLCDVVVLDGSHFAVATQNSLSIRCVYLFKVTAARDATTLITTAIFSGGCDSPKLALLVENKFGVAYRDGSQGKVSVYTVSPDFLSITEDSVAVFTEITPDTICMSKMYSQDYNEILTISYRGDSQTDSATRNLLRVSQVAVGEGIIAPVLPLQVGVSAQFKAMQSNIGMSITVDPVVLDVNMLAAFTPFSCAIGVSTVSFISVNNAVFGRIFADIRGAAATLTPATSYSWTANDWTGPDAEANIVQFPVCEHIDVLSGRVIGSIGNEVVWSEYGLPGLWDSAQSVARFPSRITMLRATEGGVYVSDSKFVYFLAGNNPNEWTKKTVLTYPALEWADYKKYIDPSKFGFESTAESILFMTTHGLVVGFPDGTVFNLTDQKYTPINKGYSSTEIVDDTDIIVSGIGGSLQIQGEVGKVGRKAVCESTQSFVSTLVSSDGALIGASPDGLFMVSGSLDGTLQIDKEFTLGTTDFGEGHQKSIKYLYVSMYGKGDFVLSIMVDRSKEWFDYPFTTYNDGINRERVDVGLGLVGRNFTIKVSTKEDFELESIDAAVVVSKFNRRTR